MITKRPTQEMLAAWKDTWLRCKDKLSPNRKNGAELLDYLQSRCVLRELRTKRALRVVSEIVTRNAFFADKLPDGEAPRPRAFYVENEGPGAAYYLPENRDPAALWGGAVDRIFVGIDLASGFYTVEGSTMLWDELCAFQGLDAADLQNCVRVAQYVACLKRFGRAPAGE